MSLTVERALSVVDRHLRSSKAQLREEKLRQMLWSTSQHGGRTVSRGTQGGVMSKGGRDKPMQNILPAFCVGWRDGPSPFDPHRGVYQCSVDAILRSAADCDEADGTVGDAVGQASGNAANETIRLPELPSLPTSSELRRVAPGGSNVDLHIVCNPLHDRLALQCELAASQQSQRALRTRQRRVKLYDACVRFHPHGVLGVKESPLGEPGEVYKAHQEHQRVTNLRETRLLRRAVETRDDSLRGAHAFREDRLVRGRLSNAPPDNLLGGVLRPEE